MKGGGRGIRVSGEEMLERDKGERGMKGCWRGIRVRGEGRWERDKGEG